MQQTHCKPSENDFSKKTLMKSFRLMKEQKMEELLKIFEMRKTVMFARQ